MKYSSALARFAADDWSGRGDSNPRLELGKLPYYPYTTAAFRYQKTYNMPHMMPQAAKRVASSPSQDIFGG